MALEKSRLNMVPDGRVMEQMKEQARAQVEAAWLEIVVNNMLETRLRYRQNGSRASFCN